MRRDIKIIGDTYLDFIKSKPCLLSALGCAGPLDPHHLIARGWREAKRNDLSAIPLCRKHHSALETEGIGLLLRLAIDPWREVAYLLMEFFIFGPDHVIERLANGNVEIK